MSLLNDLIHHTHAISEFYARVVVDLLLALFPQQVWRLVGQVIKVEVYLACLENYPVDVLEILW